MARFLFPALGVLGLATLIGCGGGGPTPSFGDDPTDATTDGGNTTTTGGGTATRAAAGIYAVAFTGTGASGTTLSGTGSGTVATDGSIALDYTAVTSGSTPVTTARKLVASVTSAGVVTGTMGIGTGDPLPLSGTLTRTGDGSPRLAASFTQGEIAETDLFTLTLRRPVAGTYDVSATGTDASNGTYSGSGTLAIPAKGNVTGRLTVFRRFGSAQIGQVYDLNATIADDGTLSGSLLLPNNFGTLATTGRVGQSASGVPQLTLNYTTTGSPAYVVTQTLTLARR